MARYPDYPGHRATDTSKKAAEAVAPHLGPLQTLCEESIDQAGVDGLTAHETAALLRRTHDSIHPRISELKKKGRVVDSGRRRLNESGKKAIVWITPRNKP